ncbi:DUF1287 domain-containing protein [Nonlabens xiamenensis]|uniref:DUF1287 domain-containing protein n=1 Tax=Nonlabens xiamenensis TaxID=2341043 RepID=UPI000F6159E9|nr:DUF1287 domain-containing protein [Nonlabens xiamenensis]
MPFKQFLVLICLALPALGFGQTDFGSKLARAAESLTEVHVVYNGAYFNIPYPNGDVPKPFGVCTDVVIRAYRTMGVDLQKLVHQDMKQHFSAYPQLWGLRQTDTNIDHRRVPNLRRFFERKGTSLAPSQSASDYQPGDVVSWVLSNGLTHIGIVSHTRSSQSENYLMVHNIGAGQVMEDVLFSYQITGHYRYANP